MIEPGIYYGDNDYCDTRFIWSNHKDFFLRIITDNYEPSFLISNSFYISESTVLARISFLKAKYVEYDVKNIPLTSTQLSALIQYLNSKQESELDESITISGWQNLIWNYNNNTEFVSALFTEEDRELLLNLSSKSDYRRLLRSKKPYDKRILKMIKLDAMHGAKHPTCYTKIGWNRIAWYQERLKNCLPFDLEMPDYTKLK